MKVINDLFDGKLYYLGSEITTESGKKYRLDDADDFSVSVDGKKVVLSATAGGYSVRSEFSVEADGAVSCRGQAVAKGKVSDKLRIISPAKFFRPAKNDALMLPHNFITLGVRERNKWKEEGKSKDFFFLYEKDAVNAALSFIHALPCKFDSEVAYAENSDGVNLSLNTVVPYSFEGDVLSEKYDIYFDRSYADALECSAEKYKADRSFECPVGWSTWDYYFTSATEDDVKENVRFIKNDPVLKDKIKYIAIDDGWQQREGDWRCGIRYPSGLKSLCKYIRDEGMIPGVWVAPTRLHNLCGTVMRRNSFLARNGIGDPIYDEDMFILDPTHPDGEKFLRETFNYLADCGFGFFKLDFVSNMFMCERFYDVTAGPFDALAKLFGIARECFPKGSHIMGCSLPYGADPRSCDSRRTGLDMHNTYKHVKKSFEYDIYLFATNGKLYRNDMDYLLVRGGETSPDEATNTLVPWANSYRVDPTDEFRWREGPDFTYSEAKMWCGALLAGGSSLFIGDKLTALKENGLDLIRKTLSAADFISAKPVPTGEEDIPEVWIKEETNRFYFFNFGEKEKEFVQSAKDGGYTDEFTGEKICAANGVLRVKVKPHDCAVLKGR